jgi:hypothetical protein
MACDGRPDRRDDGGLRRDERLSDPGQQQRLSGRGLQQRLPADLQQQLSITGLQQLSNPAYNRAPAYTTPAYNNSVRTTNNVPRTGPNGDYDRDGVPNKYDRDANGDGVPDRLQR